MTDREVRSSSRATLTAVEVKDSRALYPQIKTIFDRSAVETATTQTKSACAD
ncbi:hypothetical protein [Tychonema sp. BBK16]|uniref:hypothetical protein n=1 Tax=Tychonema sp. BBK16 TaxID=2699888 RepID=UPI0038D41C53